MMRILHRWLSIALAGLLCVTALSGAMLSLYPVLDAIHTPVIDTGLTVADLASRVQTFHPGLEQITRAPSGQISAWWFDGDQPGSAIIDPATGYSLTTADPDPQRRWLTTLHRSFFLGDGGRLAATVGALGMLVIAISGSILVARRTGGWRRWFTRLRGPLSGRLHSEIARITVLGLVLSSVTALWMAANTFELIGAEAPYLEEPSEVSGLASLAPAEMEALRLIPATELRELRFPVPGDAQDMFMIRTSQGIGYVDQGTGAMLIWQDLSLQQHISETIYMLHTGQGAAVLGFLLGVMTLGVPFMMVTGCVIWLTRRRQPLCLKGNAPVAQADTVILVGSESGSTWEFAATLADTLRDAGLSVHVAAMSGFNPARYNAVQRFLILAATYGDGDAPDTAKGFLENLQTLQKTPTAPLAILGFGDRGFSTFCSFALAVERAALTKGWPLLLPLATVDRQSPQDFIRWGRRLGKALGITLELVHQPVLPVTETLTLRERRDYGAAVQIPMTILRFALPKASFHQHLTGQGFTRFQAGDLLGILPEGSTVPRFYSLASGIEDGFIEIVVRKHTGGLSSGQLTLLEPGETVRGFLRRNPVFHANRDKTPLILIGAGTGVGPLAGFIRNNEQRRPIHLFFGLRNPDSDFLYYDELSHWKSEGRLTQLSIAISRGNPRQYVQDVLLGEKEHIIEAVRRGARIMVCGGKDMACGVNNALRDILKPVGLTPAMLKARKRYVEDTY